MKEKINMSELISLLAEKSGINKKEAEIFLKEYFNGIIEVLLEDKVVKVKSIGTFKLSQVSDRETMDVNKGVRVLIPAHNKVSYTPDTQLAKKINEPFALFESVEISDSSLNEGDVVKGESGKFNPGTPLLDRDQKEKDTFIEKEEDILPEETKQIINEEIPVIDSESNDSVLLQKNNKKTEYKRYWIIPLAAIALFTVLFFYFTKKDNLNFLEVLFLEEDAKPELILFSDQNTFVGEEVISNKDSASRILIEEISPEEALFEEPEDDEFITDPLISTSVARSEEFATSGVRKRKVVSGERLTLISLEEYGHKSFWIYLFEENKSLIKDPNNIVAGIDIIIPDPSKYGIDKRNEQSVRKAEELAEKYKK